ncbi:DUF6913 domain-containing protein [Cochleicola gelatinilyticus]|uniref:Uncharacterized protein n=1 Tax=Cochleicola gelatinilyticus TaxID=1763537 RepID=A0A167HEC6_9FLAO|nr:hypothetical protein [Cochleicola gelatinilyticus]OAB78521.1 hypothetical protein ULVI_07975 [Cochleicola gelatinilyticus]
MFRKIKLRSLRKVTDRYLKSRDTSQRNARVKTIGFLVNEADFQNFEALYEIWNELGIQRKDVKVFTFIEVKKKLPSMRQNQLNNKDVNWRGDIKNQNATEFLKTPFDVLVGYYKGANEYLDMMVAQSQAGFKVGVAGSDERLFDLLIDVAVSEPKKIRTEIAKYLRILKKIE